jgi:hypothetical protein
LKVTLLKFRDAVFAAYAVVVTAEKRRNYVPILPSTQQQPSTLAILGRDPSKDAEHQQRALPADWKAIKDAATIEDAVATHPLFREKSSDEIESIRQVWEYRFMQHRDDRNSIGQVLLDHDKAALKAAAVDAFMKAKGVGMTWAQMHPEYRQRVRNYFIEGLSAEDFMKLGEAHLASPETEDKMMDELMAKVLAGDKT